MKPVVIYTTRICPYCINAKRLFDSKKIPYQELNVDQSDEHWKTMLARSNGRRTVPQIFIGDTHVGGFDDLFALHQQGKLDALLNS